MACQCGTCSGCANTSSMWWQGPNASCSNACLSDIVPVRPNPEPSGIHLVSAHLRDRLHGGRIRTSMCRENIHLFEMSRQFACRRPGGDGCGPEGEGSSPLGLDRFLTAVAVSPTLRTAHRAVAPHRNLGSGIPRSLWKGTKPRRFADHPTAPII